MALGTLSAGKLPSNCLPLVAHLYVAGSRRCCCLLPACDRAGMSYVLTLERPRGDWAYRVVTVRSPNGSETVLEEQS